MANKTNILLSILNTGFSSAPNLSGSRLINKNGTINVKRTGLKFSQRFSVFHWLTNMSWLSFFGFLLLGYGMVNTFFASIYVALGINGLSGSHSPQLINQFFEAFYFSSQTLTTLGYGVVAPIGTAHNIVATLESFLGLMSFAMSASLMYGRFSRPRAKVLFSNRALISPFREDGKGLMIRLVNTQNDQLINVKANLLVSFLDKTNGTSVRRFKPLKLEFDTIQILASTWTIVHPIVKGSPFLNWTKVDAKELDIEILLHIEAYDETYSQKIHARTSFKPEELVWDAKFASILGNNPGSQTTLKLEHFHDYNPVENR